MLEAIMAACNNYFEVQDSTIVGTFTVAGGSIDLDEYLQNGQYIRIFGSVFNDGVFQYPVSDLTDETFTGYIVPLAVPKDFIRLASEIEMWRYSHENGVYQSETFGGNNYSYQIATNANGSIKGWKEAFNSELRRWRRI